MKTMIGISEAAAASEAQDVSILIGSYEFFGFFTDSKSVRPEPGVLVVFIRSAYDYELNAVYECGDLFRAADAELAHQDDLDGRIAVAVYYAPGHNADQLRILKDAIWSDFESLRGNT